jgi:hypothetical protein
MTSLTIPDPLPADGFPVPLRASFLVFRRVPLLGVASNSAAPKLVLYLDHLAYRVLGSRRKAYAEIETVGALQGFGTQNVLLVWKGSLLAFSGNLGRADALVEVLRFFQRRRLPLSDRAKALLRKGAA